MDCAFNSGVKKCNDQPQRYSTLEAAGQVQIEGIVIKSSTSSLTKQIVPLPQNQTIGYSQTLQQQTFQNGCPPCPPCPPCSHLPIPGQYGHENPYGFISRNGNSRDSEYPATFFGGGQMTMPHNVTAPQYNYSANITTVPTMTQVHQSQFQNPNAEQMNPLIFSRASCNGMQGAGIVNQSPVPTHLNIQPSTIFSRPAGAQHCSAVPGGSTNQNLSGSPTAQGGQLTYQGVNTLLAQDLERQQFMGRANFSNMGALNMQGLGVPPNCGGIAVGANNYYSPVQQVQHLNQQQSNLNTIKYSPLGMTSQPQQTQAAPEQYDFNIHAMRNYEAAAQPYGVQSSSPSQIYLQERSQNNINNFLASTYSHQIQNPNGLQQEHQNPYFGPPSTGLPAGSSQPGVWKSNNQGYNSNSMAANQNFNIPPDAAQTYNILDLQNELDRRQRQCIPKPISKTNFGQAPIKSTSTSTLSKNMQAFKSTTDIQTCKKKHTLNSKQSCTSTGITWKGSESKMSKRPVSPKQKSTNTNGSQTSGTRVTGITWKTSESQISKGPVCQKHTSTNGAQTSGERSTGITWKTSKSHMSKHLISRKQPSTTVAQTSCERMKTCPGLRIRKRSYLPRPCTCCSCCQPCCCPPGHIVPCDPCKRNKPDTISCPFASCKRCSCTLSCSSIPEAAQPSLSVPATATALTPEDRAKFEVCRKEMLLEQELQSQRNAMMMQQELQNQRQALLLQKEMQNQRQIFVLQQELQNRRQAMIVQKQICDSPQRKLTGMQYTTRLSSCKRKYVSPRTKSPSQRMDCNGNHVISYTNLATSARKRVCSPAGGQIGGNRYLGLQEKLSDIISTFPIGYQVNSINTRNSGGYQQHSLESRHTGSTGPNSIDNRSTGSCKQNVIGSIPTGSYQANSTETRPSGNNKPNSVDSIPTGSYKSNSTENRPTGNYKPNSAESGSTRTRSYQPSAGSRPAESFKSNHSESRRTESYQPQPHSIESRSIGLQAETSITTSAFQTDYQQEGIQIRQTRSYRIDTLEYQHVNSAKQNSKDTKPTGRYQPKSIEGSSIRSYQPNSIDSRPTGNYGQNSIESRPTEKYGQNSIESRPTENYRQNSIESGPPENYRQNSIESRPPENDVQNFIQSRSKENSQSNSVDSRSTENSQPNSNGSRSTENSQPNSNESRSKRNCQPNSIQSRLEENCQPNSLESRPVENCQPNSLESRPVGNCQPNSLESRPVGNYQPNSIGSKPQESSKPYSFQNIPTGSYQPNSIGSKPQEGSKPYSFQSRPNVNYTPNSIETKPGESYKPYSFQNIPTGNPPISSGSRPTSKRPTSIERRTMRSYSHVNENTQTQGMASRTHHRSPMLRTGRLGKTWVHKKRKSKEKRRQLECGSGTINGPSPEMCPNSNTYGQVQDNSFVQDCGCGHCRDCIIQNISKLVKFPEAQNL